MAPVTAGTCGWPPSCRAWWVPGAGRGAFCPRLTDTSFFQIQLILNNSKCPRAVRKVHIFINTSSGPAVLSPCSRGSYQRGCWGDKGPHGTLMPGAPGLGLGHPSVPVSTLLCFSFLPLLLFAAFSVLFLPALSSPCSLCLLLLHVTRHLAPTLPSSPKPARSVRPTS